MTVAIGCIDHGASEIFAATDSREVSEDRKTARDGAVKSLRLNDACAIAFSGAASHCNAIGANLYCMWRDAEQGCDDVLKRIDECAILIDRKPFEIAKRITWVLHEYGRRSMRTGEDLAEINVVLVGFDDGCYCMGQWRYQEGWPEDYFETGLIETARPPVIFGPYADDSAEEALRDSAKPLWQRVNEVVGMNHEQCPWGENLDISVRRLANQFRSEKLADLLLSNSPARDPSASASHADGDTGR